MNMLHLSLSKIPGKKYLMIGLGVVQGLLSLGLGFYLDNYHHPPSKQTQLDVVLY